MSVTGCGVLVGVGIVEGVTVTATDDVQSSWPSGCTVHSGVGSSAWLPAFPGSNNK